MKRMLHESIAIRLDDWETKGVRDLERWLLLIYRLPAEPPSARTTIWRETKKLGALALQHAVCLLADSAEHRAAYARIAQRIEEFGGEATVLETSSPDEQWQDRTIGRFNAARDEEYEEVVDEAERFREEIARERRKGKFTYAELEDEESNLERLRKYLAQVQARDTFSAAGLARAVAEVENCAEVLEAFAQDIYERQGSQGDPAH
ncbi:MAG: chromate resistance protein ChrB [Chloroflexi bacterium]|nr:chromate resistance protein ChrB [Chloroflexota bacterium]